MDRVAAARERLETVRTLARQAGEAGPPCSECRYRTLLGMCGNPAYADFKFEPSTAHVSEVFDVPVAKARSADGLCGPEGLLFERQAIPAAVAKGAVRGSWYAIRLAVFGTVALLVLAWLLR